MANYVLSDELRRAVVQVVNQHQSSFQPRPKRGRRIRPSLPSAATPSGLQNFRAVTTSVCSAATGTAGQNITPGTGFATIYLQPVDGSIGGTVWTPVGPVLFENWTRDVIPANQQILLRESRTNPTTSGPLYEVLAEANLHQFGEVYTSITAAIGWTTPGTGSVQFKTPTGGNDGSPVSVQNFYKHAFAVGDVVLCDRSCAPPRVVADKGASASGSSLLFGRMTHSASAATVAGTPTSDGLFKAFTSSTEIAVKNYYPDPAPTNAIACVQGDTLVVWSCGTLSG